MMHKDRARLRGKPGLMPISTPSEKPAAEKAQDNSTFLPENEQHS